MAKKDSQVEANEDGVGTIVDTLKLYNKHSEDELRERVLVRLSASPKLLQKQVAKEAGLTPPSLSKWLRSGTKKRPKRNERCQKMEIWLNTHETGHSH